MRINLEQQKFGRLEVESFSYVNNRGKTYWYCKCDCGAKCVVAGYNLKSGHTTSCGCFARELHRNKHLKHGMSATRQHSIWTGIVRRCTNPNYKGYSQYGQQGIGVCDKWLTFEGFWEDMKDGYSDNLTIDRIDNSEGYYKENCRWADWDTQANNKRTCIYITHNGKIQSLAQWSREVGVNYHTIKTRYKLGKRGEELLTPTKTDKQTEV